jgi:hypothetical protein
LKRTEEVVHILFACFLLLSVPDCLNTPITNGSLYFRKTFEAWGRGNIQPINFNLDYYCSTRDIYTFGTKLLFNILKSSIKMVDYVIFVLKT